MSYNTTSHPLVSKQEIPASLSYTSAPLSSTTQTTSSPSSASSASSNGSTSIPPPLVPPRSHRRTGSIASSANSMPQNSSPYSSSSRTPFPDPTPNDVRAPWNTRPASHDTSTAGTAGVLPSTPKAMPRKHNESYHTSVTPTTSRVRTDDLERTPSATNRQHSSSPPATTNTTHNNACSDYRSREASSLSHVASLSSSGKSLHEPPILMPQHLREPSGDRTSSSRRSSAIISTSSSTSGRHEEMSEEGASDTGSAESYGWTGDLDDRDLTEPSRAPLFYESSSNALGSLPATSEGNVFPVDSTPDLWKTSRQSSLSNARDAAELDPAAWWTETGASVPSSSFRLGSSDVEAGTRSEEKRNTKVKTPLDSFGIAYIPNETRQSHANRTALCAAFPLLTSGYYCSGDPSPRRSTYEPQRPSSIRSRETTPDVSRESSPGFSSQGFIKPSGSSPLVNDAIGSSFDHHFRPPSPINATSTVRDDATLTQRPQPTNSAEAASADPKGNRGAQPKHSPTPHDRSSNSNANNLLPTPLSPERKPKRAMPPPPQKSRHRASTGAKKNPMDSEQLSTNPSTAPSRSPVPIVVPERPASLDVAKALRKDHAQASPMSASEFAMAYNDQDFDAPSSSMPDCDRDDAASTRSFHVRSAAADRSRFGAIDSSASVAMPTPTHFASQAPLHAPVPRARESSTKSILDLDSQLAEAIANAATLEHDLSIAEVSAASGSSADPSPLLDKHLITRASVSSFDRRRASLIESESARASSPAVSSDDVFHDASMERALSTDTTRSAVTASSDLPGIYASSYTVEPARHSPSLSSGPKLDAKARAAAFVADLKRARAAAAAASGPPIPSSPLAASATFESSLGATADGYSSVSASSASHGSPEEVIESPSLSSIAHEARLPTPTASEPVTRLSPAAISTSSAPATSEHLASSRADSASTPTQTLSYGISPRGAPVMLTSPMSGTSAIPSAAFGSPTVHQQAPAPPPRNELRRRRPLPPSLQIVNDLKRARGPGDRAAVYAMKMKALRQQDSGIRRWIVIVKEQNLQQTSRASVSHSIGTKPTRHPRDDFSTVSFPARPDATRAKELTPGSFTRQDMIPTVPYPGVLGSIHQSPAPVSPLSSSRFSTSSLNTLSTNIYPSPSSHAALNTFKPASAIKDKTSFFTSLGRKGSKRGESVGSLSGLAPPQSISSPTLAGPSGQRLSVSTPFNASSSSVSTIANAVPIAQARMTVGGPRMPTSATPSSPVDLSARASGDTPILSSRHPNRMSAAYGGSSATVQQQIDDGALRQELGLDRDKRSDEDDDEETLEKIQRLRDILPHARPGQIRSALKRANGDDVLAISIFLSDEQDDD